MLDDEFVENPPDDPLEAVQAIYEKFEQFRNEAASIPDDNEGVSDQSLQFLSLMTVVVDKFGIEHLKNVPAASGKRATDTNNTSEYFKTVNT